MSDTPKFKIMIIRSFTLNGKTFDFTRDINIVEPKIFDAIKFILLRQNSTKKEAVFATVFINGEAYEVISENGLYAFKNDIDVTDEYNNLLFLSPEQKRLLDYNDNFDYSRQFMLYKDIERYYPNNELFKDTFGISDTRTFRKYLNEFITEFKSDSIAFNKKFKLVSKDRLKSEGINFRCFAALTDFWNGLNKIRDMNGIMQPITANKVEDFDIINRQIFVKY